MAKTNSRTKAKTITFTPASSGKSTYKPLSSNTKTTNSKPSMQKLSSTSGNIVKGQGYKAPGSNVKVTKPVTNTTAPRTRAGVSKGTAPGVGSKYSSKSTGTKPNVSKGRAGVSKGNAPGTASKYANKTPINKVDATNKVGKLGKVGKVAGKLKGVAGKAAGAATLVQLGSMVYNDVNERSKAMFKRVKAKEEKAKGDKKTNDNNNAGKPKVGGNKTGIKTKSLLETPSLKDELKKRGVDFKPVKDKAKTNWLDTAKKGDTLKYVINKPKANVKKEDSKKGALPKAIDKAVRAIDGNQPGSGESLKFKGDKSKVAGKDKWGRSPSSKWYGFNPDSKKYEAPTMIKGDSKSETKKTETKPAVKKPVTTTPKATTPAVKKAETVGTLAPKSTSTIASKSLEEAKTVTPTKTTTTTTPASTTATTSSTNTSSTTSPTVTGMQPRATIGNKIRGMLNESRERRAGRAEARGNEERADKLRDKIADSSKKMMMKKGGVVKSKSKKK
jgi:hypothetical protein